MVTLEVRNESERKRLYRKEKLRRLAERMCHGEHLTGPLEVSLLFCDDAQMTELNRRYCNQNTTTDVLSFEQEHSRAGETGNENVLLSLLGDIVISLQTVERNCRGERARMREEVSLLFCHGMLHLLGYDHGTAREKAQMSALQAHYLDCSAQAAWRPDSQENVREKSTAT